MVNGLFPSTAFFYSLNKSITGPFYLLIVYKTWLFFRKLIEMEMENGVWRSVLSISTYKNSNKHQIIKLLLVVTFRHTK